MIQCSNILRAHTVLSAITLSHLTFTMTLLAGTITPMLQMMKATKKIKKSVQGLTAKKQNKDLNSGGLFLEPEFSAEFFYIFILNHLKNL